MYNGFALDMFIQQKIRDVPVSNENKIQVVLDETKVEATEEPDAD